MAAKGPLWRALARAGRRTAATSPRRTRQLGELLAMADYTTPSRFLETILSGPLQGRRKLYAPPRPGSARSHRRADVQRARVRAQRSRLARPFPCLVRARRCRDPARSVRAPANAVRVMTVHGAKGLEAPYVILADATADPAKLGAATRPLEFPVGSAARRPADPAPQGRAVRAVRRDSLARAGARSGRTLAAALRRA